MRPLPRLATLIAVATMVIFAATALEHVGRNVGDLETLSRDYVVWPASQVELDLLRLQLDLTRLREEPTPAALQTVRRRFDLLWSRALALDRGRLGDLLRGYDHGIGAVESLSDYLFDLEPVIDGLRLGETLRAAEIIEGLSEHQDALHGFALRVARGEMAAAEAIRQRLVLNSRVAVLASLALVLTGLGALLLILRDARRQNQITAIGQDLGAAAEAASRAKSRFLGMVSHELRNPLNGVLGPLALLAQSRTTPAQQRLVQQAQASGRVMVRMLSSLLDYAEMEDGRLRFATAPMRPADLLEAVAASLAEGDGQVLRTRLRPGTPERVEGDIERLREIFFNLGQFLGEARLPGGLALEIGHHGRDLFGEILVDASGRDAAWRLDLLDTLGERAPDQVATEAIRPLIARGLIAAAGGTLSLATHGDGRRIVRVSIPASVLPPSSPSGSADVAGGVAAPAVR